MLNKSLGLNDWVGLALKCGEINIRTMELLDAGNTGKYGHPVPTKVPLGHKKGKAILISGHDLKDLEELLKQTEGKGINVYTHGEMLPTHGYPGLKKYAHFYGHYGTAWQNQAKEFAEFPGPIVMTTNCIQKPRESYMASIYTIGPVGWPGATHLKDRDFSAVIKKAQEMPGFAEDAPGKTVMVGFGEERRARRGTGRHRRGEEQADTSLLPGRRLRRREGHPQLLHGVRGESPEGHAWC